MDRKQIIRMAREAGCKPFRSPEHWDDVQVFATPDVLERFAALVAAHEREVCAKVCEDIPLPKDSEALTHLPTIERCAAVIRARGEK